MFILSLTFRLKYKHIKPSATRNVGEKNKSSFFRTSNKTCARDFLKIGKISDASSLWAHERSNVDFPAFLLFYTSPGKSQLLNYFHDKRESAQDFLWDYWLLGYSKQGDLENCFKSKYSDIVLASCTL